MRQERRHTLRPRPTAPTRTLLVAEPQAQARKYNTYLGGRAVPRVDPAKVYWALGKRGRMKFDKSENANQVNVQMIFDTLRLACGVPVLPSEVIKAAITPECERGSSRCALCAGGDSCG